MATTSVWPVKKRLDHVLDYAMNPDKTSEHAFHDDMGNVLTYVTQEEKVEYVTGVNCLPEHAREQMMLTKQVWNKTGGRLAYHGYQSFKPGEVTPQQAHEIGVELARRMWGNKYQVVVATHTDRLHVHNHFVINSVSFVDGKKYVHTKKDYYGGVRAISDEVCREFGASVIEHPKAKGKHYKEAMDEKAGKPTRRGLVRADVQEAIEKSLSFESFVKLLESKGYAVKHGPRVTHIAVKPKDCDDYMRLYKLLGSEYEESNIRAMIEKGRSPGASHPGKEQTPPLRGRPRRLRVPQEHRRLKGIRATYYKYLYLLGKVGKRKAPQRVSFALRGDLAKLDRYRRQFIFLQANRIESTTQLGWYADALKNEIDLLLERRKPLYAARRSAWASDVPAITTEIESINAALRPLRQKLRLCTQIGQDAEYIAQKAESVQAVLERAPERTKTKERNKQPRHIM